MQDDKTKLKKEFKKRLEDKVEGMSYNLFEEMLVLPEEGVESARDYLGNPK